MHAATVGLDVPTRLWVARGLVINAFSGARLRRLDWGGVDDIYAPLGHDDVLYLELAIDLAQKNLPQIVFHQLLAKTADSCGIQHIATQFEVAEFPEQKVAK